MIVLTSASGNDLIVFKNECIPYLDGKTVFANNIYSDFSFFGDSNPVKMRTSHKQIKDEPKIITKGDKLPKTYFPKLFPSLDNL